MKPYKCDRCSRRYTANRTLQRHQRSCGQRMGGPFRSSTRISVPKDVWHTETAMNKSLYTFVMDNNESYTDVMKYLQARKRTLRYLISEQMKLKKALKVNIFLECLMKNAAAEIQLCNYKTTNKCFFQASDVEIWLDQAFLKIIREIEECASKDSGWALHEIKNLELRTNKFVPLCA
jgi:mannose-1-phosphate guanylyltransferase